MNDKLLELLNKIDFSEISLEKIRHKYKGIPVPSVTQILSKCIHEDYIVSWANYLGFRRIKYKDELNSAAILGTKGHSAIEDYLRNGTTSDNIPYLGFRLWWDIINTDNTIEILGIEEEISLPFCGGTYDLLLSINGLPYLVDLKTSNHISYKYFIQLAAYRYMLYITKGINVNGVIVLQVDKNEPGFNEYLLDLSNTLHYQFMEHCCSTFFSLVLSYYNIHKAESLYKQIF